jgi:hypothetical protein
MSESIEPVECREVREIPQIWRMERPPDRSTTTIPNERVTMLKKLAMLAIVGVVAKVVLDKLTGRNDAELWAEATDSVR